MANNLVIHVVLIIVIVKSNLYYFKDKYKFSLGTIRMFN